MSTEPRFDENALRALFDEVEAPASMETRWKARVALAPEIAPRDLPEVRRIDDVPLARPRRGPRLKAIGAAAAAVLVGGGIVGIVAANRPPSPDPQPSIVETITDAPSTLSKPPPQSETSQPSTIPTDTSGAPAPGGPTVGALPGAGGTGTREPAGPPAPARGPLGPGEWPDAANSGVPAGTKLQQHNGDLHVTQAGALVADMHVSGTVFVEAPDVTLRRVQVEAPSGADAGIRQQAPRLRVEDSEVSGLGIGARYGIRQEASGLVVQRGDIHGSTSAVAISSDATVVDSYLSDVRTSGNTARIIVRHNTIAWISLLDDAGPVTDVTIENNQLGPYGSTSNAVVIVAPYRSGSRDIRVTGNQFLRSAGGQPIPVSGWNAQAPGNTWAGNVWVGTSEPVNP